MPPDHRALIARAAWLCAQETGLRNVTVAEIARRAGCTPRTFWNHFADREQAVLDAVLPSPLATSLFPAVPGRHAPPPDRHRMVEQWQKTVTAAVERGDLDDLAMLGALAQRDRSLADVVGRSWVRLIRAAQASSVTADDAAAAALSASMAAAVGTAVTGSVDGGGPRAASPLSLLSRIEACFAAVRSGAD